MKRGGTNGAGKATEQGAETSARVPLRWVVLLHLMRRLPQAVLSRSWGRLTELRLPRPLRGTVNRGFARLVGADLAEAELPPEAYGSLSEFFVRGLRPGIRRWPDDPGIPGSPVDGILGEYGPLEEGQAIQAKGIPYRVGALLGGGDGDDTFAAGLFFTIYLSPRHYHRIHAPLDAAVREARAIPGRLLPVNQPAVRVIGDLFPRNERLVALMEAGRTPIALAAVGAYNVGRILAAFDPAWNGPGGRGVTNRSRSRELEARSYDPPLRVVRGGELMTFQFGSTIVLLIGGKRPRPHPELRVGMEIALGTPLLADPLDGRGSDG